MGTFRGKQPPWSFSNEQFDREDVVFPTKLSILRLQQPYNPFVHVVNPAIAVSCREHGSRSGLNWMVGVKKVGLVTSYN